MVGPDNPPPPGGPPRGHILIRAVARDYIAAYDTRTGLAVADARMIRLGTWEIVCRGVTRRRHRRRAALRTLTELALGAR